MKKIILLFAFLTVCFLSLPAQAFNTQTLRYYFIGTRGLSVVATKPKPVDTLTIGLGFNYAHHPLEFGNSVGNNRIQGIVDQLYTFDFSASYSFSDRVALGVNIPVHITNNLVNMNGTAMETPFNIGDIMLSGIYNVIDPDTNNLSIGFSVIPFVSFPTGRSGDYVGDSHVTGGLLLAGDISFLDRHTVGLNLGVRFREEENFLNLDIAHELLYAIAYNVNVIPDADLDAFLEFGGSAVMKDFLQQEIQSPFEGRLGVSKGFLAENQLKATIFSGMGFTSGYGAPNIRLGLKVTYDHMIKGREVVKIVEKRVEKVERKLKELTIYYPTDGAQVDPFYDQKIAAIAEILQENPDLGPLYIVGHTDDVGSNGYNQKLSEKRAKKAARSIIEHGLDPKNIVWVGLGEEYPVMPNASAANRALNRRTLFTYIKPAQLQEKQTYRGVQGINTVTGKKNDSYTEVLKEQERLNKLEEAQKEVVVEETTEEVVLVKEPKETKKKKKKTKKAKKKKKKVSAVQESDILDDAEDYEQVDF